MTNSISSVQQDANWRNLSPEQRTYFNGLASADPNRTGQEFFEDTVPPTLQDDPSKLEVFLNGGTVTTQEIVFDRGRAGATYETVTHEVYDRDWSHDTSRANGGSDSADNGRWESSSINRSRGADNTTLTEQRAADASARHDAQLLDEGSVTSLAQDAETSANLTLAAEGVEATSMLVTAGEFALDMLAPAIGGICAGKLAADQFDKTQHKLIAGGLTGTLTTVVLCTPVGQVGLGCYLGYKLVRTGHKFMTKSAA